MNAPLRQPLAHVDASACSKLWLAVLAEMWNVALFDGLSAVRPGVGEVAAADRWFGSRDFRMVCALAGLDAEKVLAAYTEAKTGDAVPAGVYMVKRRVARTSVAPKIGAEEWRPIPGFSSYEVSSMGRVRSFLCRAAGGAVIVDRQRRPRIINGEVSGAVRLRGDDGQLISRRVHLLVLEVFAGPAPRGAMPLWLDGNQRNNAADNLVWRDRQGVAA